MNKRAPDDPATGVDGRLASGLSYQEMLRTLGMLLDKQHCTTAVIVLTPEGAEVMAPTWPYDRQWSLEALARESAAQRALRSTKPPEEWRVEGLRWALRPVGAELDARGPGRYVVMAQGSTVHVQGAAGYERLLDVGTLRRLALSAVTRRSDWPVALKSATNQED